MKHTKFAILAATVACLVSPVVASAAGPPSNSGTQNAAAQSPNDSGQPGPGASLPAKAKAYGRYCQNQSKTHVAGQTGTPFSQCVTAMAKLASGTTSRTTSACSAMSKTHVAGEKGTPFSRCVAAGAKLLKDQHQS
jgi:hypothetical protein